MALFVLTELKCKVNGDMTFSRDNLMECVTVEIKTEKFKNILLSCIYRTPGSCTDKFNKEITDLFEKHCGKVLFCLW